MRLTPIIALAATAIGAPAAAATFMDHSTIDAQVAQFTGAAVGTQGGARLPVDRRLRLAQCEMPLALEWYGNKRDTVLVRCPEANGWRIFVPVVSAPVGAPAQDIVARGEVVSITVSGRGFTLSRQGEALEAGSVGEWIRVRPVGTRDEPIRVQVLQPGRVGMDLP